MKILSIKLNNYIGPYNGMGLNELFIDFTKCKNKIVVIRGANGSGKSELFLSLHVFPDNTRRLIPNLPASKEIMISYANILYFCKIIYGVKKDGSRDTTKAYIRKIVEEDGTNEELNPNGNITSYKEVIFSEFSLDPNFISLSELSSAHRGLADMTPAERKKFINAIISSIQIYNDIYKTLTKRSSIFKSMINSLTSKISSIGDEENTKMLLKSIEDRLNLKMTEKEQVIEHLAVFKSKIQILDPDGSIQLSYNNIYQNLVSINKEIKSVDDKIKASLNKLNINEESTIDDIMNNYKKLSDIITSLEMSIKINESKINNLLLEKENEVKEIQEKTVKMESLKAERNFNDLSKQIQNSKIKIKEYLSIIHDMGFSNIDNISKDEFVIGLNMLKEVKDVIDSFKSDLEYDILQKSIEYYKSNYYPDIDGYSQNIKQCENNISSATIEYQKYEMLLNISSKLEMRPSNCKIDKCAFIKDAVEADMSNPKDNIEKLHLYIKEQTEKLEYNKNMYSESEKIIDCVNRLKTMIRNINSHASILNKLPISNVLSDDSILDKIIYGYDFKEFNVLYGYIQYANVIEDYKKEVDILKELEHDYSIYESKSIIINEIMNDIDNLNNKLNGMIFKIDESNKEIIEDKAKLSNLKSNQLEMDLVISLYTQKDKLISEKQDSISKFECIKSNIIQIKECANNIDTINQKLDFLNKEIQPLIDDRDQLKHAIQLIIEYKEELKIYSLKYEKVETIKKYSSPNKGIQTLFMELYMNKTISMANELLSLLFDGKFALTQYVINENEFRIPCIGNNIPNNDISDMSTAQICMISMILSFVLLQQSSTKYNILRLDEIDGALDTNNRIHFITVLNKLIDILQVEQCIMVSHNTEMDLSNCDVIQLKDSDWDMISNSNIIYQYQN